MTVLNLLRGVNQWKFFVSSVELMADFILLSGCSSWQFIICPALLVNGSLSVLHVASHNGSSYSVPWS